MVVAAVAVLAGGDAVTAARLGLAMSALQVSIGALNDIVDAPRDIGLKSRKPIPAGLVSARLAWVVVAAGGGLGVVLSAPSGLATLVLAALALAIGYSYDLVFKGTAWSWVPFAVGIPLLPVFGWLGSTGSLPPSFAVLLPVAVVAGTALAIANARADAERDAATGVDSVAIRLGPERAWAVHAALLAVAVATALLTLLARGAATPAILAATGAALVTAIGVAVGRNTDSSRREWAWEIEAIGVGLLAAAWLAGIPS